MTSNLRLVWKLAVALLLPFALSACSQHSITAPPVGFLSQPDLMKKSSGGSWSYNARGVDWNQYKSVFVAPVAVAPDALEDPLWGTAEDLAGLAADFKGKIVNAMDARYTPVDAAGPGVLVVRAQITRVKPNAPGRNVAPQTQILQSGYGFGQVAVEVLDGGDSRVLVEFADVQSTTRFSTEKLSVWGSLEKSFGEWANRVAKACGAQ